MNKTHHPRWLVILRIGLGIVLCAKGIQFIYDPAMLDRVLYGDTRVAEDNTHWLPILITWANLLGGFFILIGLFTRLAIMTQIPILVGAVIFIAAQKGQSIPKSELYWSTLCLTLILVYLVAKTGPNKNGPVKEPLSQNK